MLLLGFLNVLRSKCLDLLGIVMAKSTSGYRQRIYCSLSVSLFLLLFFYVINPNIAAGDESSQALGKAREKYLQLKKSPQKQKYRENWQQVIDAYKKVADDPVYNSIQDEIIFTLSNIYFGLYRYSGSTNDLNNALNSFRLVYANFPTSSYADDALFMMGEIYYRFKKIPLFAQISFEKVVDQYPNSDMAPLAKERLKEIGTVSASLTTTKNEAEKRAPAEEASSKNLQYVSGVRHWTNPSYTRIVLDISGPVDFKDNRLSNPDRLFIDLFPARLNLKEHDDGITINDGLLKKVRMGQNKADVVRIVLDIDYIEKYRIFALDNPFRIIIDVKGKDEKPKTARKNSREPDNAVPRGSSQGRPPQKLTLAQQLNLGINRVVIDPGHGGKDPGAIGPSGLMEKEIVLDVAKRIKSKLETQLGLEVILTRDRDVFIPLEERTAIANAREADLFVSIHVNAHRKSATRGIETYFLNLASSEDAMEVAARENMVSQKKMSNLENILSDILLTSKIHESSRLAQRVQKNLVSDLKKTYDGISDLGVKQAPFYVLIGAQMPSILVEISFISNQEEEARLQKEKYRENMAQGILRGIEEYAHQMKIAFQN